MPRVEPATPTGLPPEWSGARRRQQARSPKRLVREKVGIVNGPVVGCEYRAVGHQVATAGFEPQSSARGSLAPGDIVFPVEARPSRGRWRMRLILGEGEEVWVSEIGENGAPLLEMVTDGAALEEGQPPMRIPDVDGPSASTTPERPLPTSPAMRPGFSAASPPHPWRGSEREDQESVMNEAITQSLSLGPTGRHAVANFLPLRDFLRQEVHRLCEAVQDAEKQAEEEVAKRQTLEQQLTDSQQTKQMLQSQMSINVQAAEAEAAREKQRRESLQSQLRELQQGEGGLRLKLRDEIAEAERRAEVERLEREAVQARLAEVQAAERHSREQLGRDVVAAQARADQERKRREDLEEQIATAKVEHDKHAMKLRDAVMYAESQLMRERNSREDLELQLSDQLRQDDEKRNTALAAVAEAQVAAASEREERERLQQRLEHAQAANEQQAAELRAEIDRVEQNALAERRDREAKDSELQNLKSSHAEHLETLRAKLDDAVKLAEGEKKLRQSIEVSIADARNAGQADVADMTNKLKQAEADIEREREQRQSAEEKLERVSAEEKDRAANLSQMLQLLSTEVRAARTEVETLRSGNNPAHPAAAHPAAMASLETWMDQTGVHVDRNRSEDGTIEGLSQVPHQGDQALALSQLQETHELLKKDADTLKQQLVSALRENQEKSEKLKEERAKRKELRAEMERKTAEEVAASEATGLSPRTPPDGSQRDHRDESPAAVDATVAAMLAAAEETAMAHHDRLADEIATHVAEHASQQAVADEQLIRRLQISGDALAQAVNQCKVANDTAKAMQVRLCELTRERDDALQELIEFKREQETQKAKKRNSLAMKQQAGPEDQEVQGPGQRKADCDVNESLQLLVSEQPHWERLCQECESQITVLRDRLQETQKSVESLTAERDELKARIESQVTSVDDGDSANTHFSPVQSRELQRELNQLRDIASARKQELDQRGDELARLEAGRDKYVTSLVEKDDEIESLKKMHADEVKSLHDQLIASHEKSTQHEREQGERYASSLAEANARAAAAYEDRDRANATCLEERTKADERLRHVTEKHDAAVARSDMLLAELDEWLDLSQQSALRAAVVSNNTSRDRLSGDITLDSLSPKLSTIGDTRDDDISVNTADNEQGGGQSLTPVSPVQSDPSVIGGWMSPTPTPAIREGSEGEEEEDEDSQEGLSPNSALNEESLVELNDESLAELYRLVRTPVCNAAKNSGVSCLLATLHVVGCPSFKRSASAAILSAEVD